MQRRIGLVTLTVLAVLMPVASRSGVIIDIEHREEGDKKITGGRLYLDKGFLKMIPDTGDADEPELIYQGSQARMLIIDHDKKTYMSIDAEMMQQLADRMAGVRAQMEQALAQLPPEQRQAAENMMRQRMPDMGAGPREVRVVAMDGRHDKQGKPCQGYEVRVNGELTSRIWTTDWKNVDIDSGDFAVFAEMAGFFEKLMKSIPMMAEQNATELFSGLNEIDGFPVLFEGLKNGVSDSQTIFGDPRTQKLDAATFEPPSGYKEQTMQDQDTPNSMGR